MSKTINCLVDHKGAPCTCDMSMYENLNKPMSTTTQNDYKTRYDFITPAELDSGTVKPVIRYTKQELDRAVADARKEVIEKVEKWTREGLADGNFEEIDRLKNLLDFLATLRKESK